MSQIRFEWDPKKAKSNQKKHGVSFEEAQSVFFDEQALLLEDPQPLHEEERFVLLGVSATLRLLVVVHALRERNVIRIISARKATRNEAREYEIRLRERAMKEEYDFSKAKKNPYAKRLKRRVTIRLDGPTIDYFKELAEETGIPYQTLINLYLRDCAESKKELNLEWRPESVATG